MTPPAAPVDTPAGLARRLASFVYEGVVLFGVVMVAGYLYSSLTQQRHALQGQIGLKLFLFVVLGIYFVWFWSHGGQTVAMKAWHLRLVRLDGRPVGQWQALARYVASWIWFLPALAVVDMLDWRSTGAIFGALTVGVLVYAFSSRPNPSRQFWHDRLCRTQLVVSRPVPRPAR